MTTLAINTDQFTAAGLTWTPADDGKTGTFSIPNPSNSKKPMKVTVQINAGNILLLPDRSFLHRTLANMLGSPP